MSLGRGLVINTDAASLLARLRDGSADIVFIDPPFNLGKSYGDEGRNRDRFPEHEYAAQMAAVLARAMSVLKPGGALYLYHLPRWALAFGQVLAQRLVFRHWIAISMKNGFQRGSGLYPAHYALLYFTKGEPVHFSRPKLPPPRCRHCNGYIKDYGGYAQYVAGGINLSDFWDDISPVRHNKHKTRSANELPLVLARRVVQMSGAKGGLLVDPFAGAGTSLIAALEGGMHFVGGDLEPSACRVIAKRVRRFQHERSGDDER